MPDVTKGNHGICASPPTVHPPGKVLRYITDRHADEANGSITLQPRAKYFLRCQVSSNHAQYSWHHHGKEIPCSSREQGCLLLIDSMGPEQEGNYACMSEEMGFSRVIVQYQLQLRSRAAGPSWNPLIWFCLMAVLIKSLSK